MGLINQEMGGTPPARNPSVNAEEIPGEVESAEAAPDGDEGPDSETDPAYQAGLELTHKTLYADGAAKDVAETIKSSPDPIEEIANVSYEIMLAIDEKTNSSVPDELLVSLAIEVMSEVAEVAEAAGIQIGGAEVAQAMRAMLMRFAQETGMDTGQLEQAMSQIDPAELGAAVEQKAGEQA